LLPSQEKYKILKVFAEYSCLWVRLSKFYFLWDLIFPPHCLGAKTAGEDWGKIQNTLRRGG
jgi:hypothetical protein